MSHFLKYHIWKEMFLVGQLIWLRFTFFIKILDILWFVLIKIELSLFLLCFNNETSLINKENPPACVSAHSSTNSLTKRADINHLQFDNHTICCIILDRLRPRISGQSPGPQGESKFIRRFTGTKHEWLQIDKTAIPHVPLILFLYTHA